MYNENNCEGLYSNSYIVLYIKEDQEMNYNVKRISIISALTMFVAQGHGFTKITRKRQSSANSDKSKERTHQMLNMYSPAVTQTHKCFIGKSMQS